MTAFAIPTNLDAAPEWIARLPDVVAELAERWGIRVGEPYQPGGQCSWVAPARAERGDDLVLKVGLRHFEADQEADGLVAWDGDGAVRVYASHVAAQYSALLLERCRPGTPLAASIGEVRQDAIVAGLLMRLWRTPVDAGAFRVLVSMCDAWADSYEEAGNVLDPGLSRAGIEMFRTLPRTSEREVLLVTDLHAGNIVAAQREPWLVIDPKPYLGDPAYDVLQHMLNCERLTVDPHRLAVRMAELTELEAERVARWLFARCVIDSRWRPELIEVAVRLAPVALS